MIPLFKLDNYSLAYTRGIGVSFHNYYGAVEITLDS
jgi:hypothetical protein